jgi:hypothetical protein
MRWKGHVTFVEQEKSAYKLWVEELEEQQLTTKPSTDRKIILKWFLTKWDGRLCTGFIRFGMWSSGFHLRIRFRKILRISILTEEILTYQEKPAP